ncbi:hypothetical protein M3599_03540 [Niallia circulans]|uniref:hypothetical protein n=1 Tax=Niallia circulans TaxID=1397 RepID=UPI0020402FE0|nr:hypothetical protein [Niallia circulans]MCM2979998.1 hypothetical protein [Niallia circulans]
MVVTCGGSAVAGDTVSRLLQASYSRNWGIHNNFEKIRLQFTINFEHGFDDYYLIEYELDLNELTIQTEEVQAVKWASKEVQRTF